MRVVIPVFSGFEELDAIAPLEVFGLAKQAGLPVDVSLASHTGAASVRGFHGVEVCSLDHFCDATACDVIVVPGGAWLGAARDGVRQAVAEGILPGILRAHFERGCVVASVCTGAFLLERAGLLAGIPATTHHLALNDLSNLGVNVVADRVVDAGQIITAGGITSGLDLALHIVERAFGNSAQIAEIL